VTWREIDEDDLPAIILVVLLIALVGLMIWVE